MMKRRKTIWIEVAFKKHEEGGRIQLPVGSGYSPHILAEGSEELLGIRFLDFPSDAAFSKPCVVEVELLYHENVNYNMLTEGRSIRLVEGPKAVAVGKVIKVP